MKLDFSCESEKLKKIELLDLSFSDMEFMILEFLIHHEDKQYLPKEIASKLYISLDTVQRSLKSFTSKDIIFKIQDDPKTGGHVFHYQARPKSQIKKNTVDSLLKRKHKFDDNLDKW